MKIIVYIVFLLVSACTQDVGVGEFTKITVKDRGADGESAKRLCSEFSLTESQVGSFFSQAKPISREKAHHEIDYLSCWVNGDLVYKNKTCQWHIDAGGLANIYCGNNTYKFYCEACEDILKE